MNWGQGRAGAPVHRAGRTSAEAVVTALERDYPSFVGSR